jgi:hypothetical protein
MVGATPAAAAAIVNGCCTLMATNPTWFSVVADYNSVYLLLAGKTKGQAISHLP